ncbi:hypothetical protein FIBSPDRAFT_1053201 [Athelia psychrophila]|uniref:Uncharacterized protein n=1 Tax=Athelia psychrophila TaxID=1759441 RepID=A0A167XB32_9AGAM|nr:hypothetical protein FIBSPDRAFT_1053201 [Fibularhizoctonia sp. CBS 109695]
MYNSTGFSDLWPLGAHNVTAIGSPYLSPAQAVNASYSNTASILQCNPHFRNETRLINMVNQTFTIHEVASTIDTGIPDITQGEGVNGVGLGPVLAAILNPILGVNWAAGELTLQALGNTSKSNINGVAYYDVPLAPEVIASNIGKYVQSAAKPYLVQGLGGVPATQAQTLLHVTAFQTSLEQMFATIGLVVLILVLAITLLIVGMGSLPLTVSTVEAVLQGKEANYG